jgi:hypothetical protein
LTTLRELFASSAIPSLLRQHNVCGNRFCIAAAAIRKLARHVSRTLVTSLW